MMIDCDSCTMKDIACDDCVVTFLTIPVGPPASAPARLHALAPAERGRERTAVLAAGGGAPPRATDLAAVAVAPPSPWAHGTDLGEDERIAIAVLAGSGLVPPLRMACPATGLGPPAERAG